MFQARVRRNQKSKLQLCAEQTLLKTNSTLNSMLKNFVICDARKHVDTEREERNCSSQRTLQFPPNRFVSKMINFAI